MFVFGREPSEVSGASGGERTYILDQGEALVFAVLELLLLSQVLALGRLETHGYHLCARQHVAPLRFDVRSLLRTTKTKKASSWTLRLFVCLFC